MAHIMGSPYKRGNSDVIQAYNRPTADIEEGLAVIETNVVTIAAYTGAGNTIPVAVMGGTEFKGASAVKCGLEVCVQVPDTVNTIAVTDKVYVTAAGKFTNVAEGNTQINATWCADASGATLWSDGIVSVGANKRKNQKCGMISFAGGF